LIRLTISRHLRTATGSLVPHRNWSAVVAAVHHCSAQSAREAEQVTRLRLTRIREHG
jgi:hypothetical protein